MRKNYVLLAALLASGTFIGGRQTCAAQSTPNYVFQPSASSEVVTQFADIKNPSTSYTVPGATLSQLEANIPGLQAYTPVAGSSIPSGNGGLQFSNTFTASGSSSVGAAGLYQVTNSTDMTVGLAAGTGVYQNNGTHSYTGASVLDIHFTAVWHLNAAFQLPPEPIFFPGLSYSLPVGGVVGIGGDDHFITDINFSDSSIAGSVGSLNINQDFDNTNGTSAMAFQQTFSGAVLLNHGSTLPAGSNLTISGDIVFKAKNDDSPSGFTFGELGDDDEAVNPIPGDPNAVGDATFGVFNSVDPLPDPAPLPTSLAMGGLGITLAVVAMKRSSRRAKAI